MLFLHLHYHLETHTFDSRQCFRCHSWDAFVNSMIDMRLDTERQNRERQFGVFAVHYHWDELLAIRLVSQDIKTLPRWNSFIFPFYHADICRTKRRIHPFKIKIERRSKWSCFELIPVKKKKSIKRLNKMFLHWKSSDKFPVSFAWLPLDDRELKEQSIASVRVSFAFTEVITSPYVWGMLRYVWHTSATIVMSSSNKQI